MYSEIGRKEDALREALVGVAYLTNSSSTTDVLLFAELLYELRQFKESADLYTRLAIYPGNNKFTRRLLICLVESDQRRKAQELIRSLDSDVLALPAFQRIEANLAYHMGDYRRMKELLEKEILRRPQDSSVALSYATALHQLNDSDSQAKLNELLESDPKFKESDPEDEFNFAKYQNNNGFSLQAVNRLYRLYRDNSASTAAASFYLGLVMLGTSGADFSAPAGIAPGCLVSLTSESGDRREIAIDIDQNSSKDSWPELIGSESEVATKLHGHVAGDVVALNLNRFGEEKYTVKDVSNLYVFVANKAQQQLASAAVPAGPLRSVKVISDDGKPNVDLLLQSLKQRAEHVLDLPRPWIGPFFTRENSWFRSGDIDIGMAISRG
jgi:tetratricopeptide (TPR) repeat protein